MSNKAAIVLLSSTFAFLCLSMFSPHAPVFFLTSSSFVEILSKDSIICKPPLAPCLPKTSLSTFPTACESCGIVFSFELISWMTSKVLLLPLCKSFSTCLLLIPIASRLSDVVLDISRIFLLAIVMRSMPLSVKIPLLVCWMIATICFALSPASLNAGAYCFILAIIFPFKSAPL